MAGPKQNDWFGASQDEDEADEWTHDSDDDDSKLRQIRSAKRRKLSSDEEISASDLSQDEFDAARAYEMDDEAGLAELYEQDEPWAGLEQTTTLPLQTIGEGEEKSDHHEINADDDAMLETPHADADAAFQASSPKARSKKPKPTLAEKLARSAEAARRSGVVYISRIPPYMKPHTLKRLLTPHAPSGLGRMFLAPEASDVHRARVRAGGNKKRRYGDGWMEFLSKREAKIAVEALNAKQIGGKKGGYYYDDVWNLKYLKGFKWRHLTEQMANEAAERESRKRAEDRQTRREIREFLGNVEKSKALAGMEKKREAKRKRDAGEDWSEDGLPAKVPDVVLKKGRSIHQRTPIASKPKNTAVPLAELPQELKDLFSKLV